MEELHDKIRAIRLSKNVNQSEMANSIGISRNAYVQIEKGVTKSISIEAGKKIAEALQVSFNELFEIEQESKIESELKGEKEELDNQIAGLYKQQDYHLELIRGKRSLFRLIYSQLSTIISQLETNPDNTNILELKASLASIVQAIDELENFTQLEIDLETRKKERDEKRALKAKQRE